LGDVDHFEFLTAWCLRYVAVCFVLLRASVYERRELGREQPDTLSSMNDLAFTLKHQQRDDEAIVLTNSCEQICVKRRALVTVDRDQRLRTPSRVGHSIDAANDYGSLHRPSEVQSCSSSLARASNMAKMAAKAARAQAATTVSVSTFSLSFLSLGSGLLT